MAGRLQVILSHLESVYITSKYMEEHDLGPFLPFPGIYLEFQGSKTPFRSDPGDYIGEELFQSFFPGNSSKLDDPIVPKMTINHADSVLLDQ